MGALSLVAGAAALLAGCSPGGSAATVDQSKLCIASTDEQAMQCPEGELILARLDPRTSQMRAYNVLNTVALYCDTNQRIVHNDAGVVCTLTKARIDSVATDRRSPPADAAPAGDNGATGAP